MNIESILDKINSFESLVIESGLKRDVNDYIQSIQQPQNRNLVFMKDLASNLLTRLDNIEDNSLNSDLKIILKDSNPFTDLKTISELNSINNDNEIDAENYFQKFNSILSQLFSAIETNKIELDKLNNLLSKYTDESSVTESENEQALMSLIFRDLKTTSSLKEFCKVLTRWNRTLILYQTLLKSESPEDISLVEIQNGSIDVLFNIDIDISINLAEVLKVGLKVYGAYLLYKSKRAREIIDAYMGNKKLIAMEQEREILMLDNIKDSINSKLLEQHKEKLKLDKKIDKVGVDKKIEEISAVITDHIIKGNEIKLLTAPTTESKETNDLPTTLKEDAAIVRTRLKQISKEDKQLLIDKYSLKDDVENTK
jgi:hypothetical protein